MLRSVSRVLGGLAPQTDTQEDAVRALVYAGLGVRARPARLGRYRVGEVLGRGGSGTVFEAYDEQLDRTVAIKVMRARPEGAEHEDTAQRRLLREAKAAARLEHPNVVRVFDLGRYGAEEAEDLAGTIAAHGVFLVMERVDGIDLRRWMTTPRDPEDVMDVLLQAGEGLAAAHRCDLVHRDFKPANVLVGDGVVKVADFGLARSAHHSGLETPEGSSIDRLSTVTREGAVAGTPPYMAPEQYGGRPGPAADQFALCVTVYEALAGVRPFPDDPIEGQAAKLAGKVPPHPALSDELYAVLRRGLAPRAEQRYPTVRALLEDLRRPPRRSRRWPWLGLALAVGLGSLWSVTRPDPCTAPAPTIQALERLAAESEPPAQRRLRIEADALRDAWASVCNGDTVPEAHRRCLLERSEERSRLVALAQEGVLDASLVQEAIAKLPAPMSCVGQRPERSSEPADPRAAEAAGKLRARLTSAAALADLGLVDPATAEIEAVRTAADALGHEPLRLAAAAAQGHVELQARRIDEAQRTLETVYWQANELDELALMTRAATELAFIHGRHRADPPTARRWERHADAALERRGRPPWEHAGLLNVQAANRLTEGDLEAGAALFEQAIASLERARGDRDLEIAVAATNLGEALSRLGRQPDAERALERAAAIRREHYGDEDVSQVSNMVHLAKVRERQGRAEEGVQLLMRARTLMERDDPGGHPWRPAVLTILGASLGRQERFTEAAEAFSAAIAQLDDAGHHDSQWAKLHKNLGLVHERLGHAAQAEQHYALALSGLDSGDPLRVEALLQVADFELQRGHRDRARARLAEAEAEAAASSGPLDRFTSEELERLRRQLG